MATPDQNPPLAPLSALENAHLRWNEGAPEAIDFDDVYFSRDDGRRETEHVFIHNNRLEERFTAWDQQRPFVIAETGFGSGLNAMCAWRAFEHHAPSDARLHFISVERFPMTADDLKRTLSVWPEFSELASALVAQWPPAIVGVHRLYVNDRFTIDLHFGEASERFSQLDGRVDAWFLDGFAPSKNPEMWQQSLFHAMARVSRPGTTFATFTAAGFVKRGLIAEGFECEKVRGFGRKRDMLRGVIPTPPDDTRRTNTPWYAAAYSDPHKPQRIAIIGAGIAGCSTAYALAQRGHMVTLFDPDGVAQGASGNHQAALYIKLAASINHQSRFYLSAMLHLNRLLHRLAPNADWWKDCGTLDIAITEKQADRQNRFLAQSLPEEIVRRLSPSEASTRAGVDISHIQQALFYPQGGWLSPTAFCQRLIQDDRINVIQASVTRLAQDLDKRWILTLNNNETTSFDQVVVCNAYWAQQLAPVRHLPLQSIRGQVNRMPTDLNEKMPQSVICGSGYVPPVYEGQLTFGATFAPNVTDLTPTEEDTRYNLTTLSQALPTIIEENGGEESWLEKSQSRVSLRTASPDKSPFVGAAPDIDQWQSLYAVLSKDARRIPKEIGPRMQGLWVNVAHGSRGMVSAPLSGELIASRISGEPTPMELALVDHLDPGRRIIRDIITSEQGH